MRRGLLLLAAAFVLSGCDPGLTTLGSWTRLPTAPPRGNGTTVTALPDGRALVLGGVDLNTGEPTGQALIFDPSENRWSQVAPLPEPRSAYAAVALANDSVLVAGGMGPYTEQSPSGPLASAWLFDARRNTWRRVGDLKLPLVTPSAVPLSDGRVLLVGGSNPGQDTSPSPPGTTGSYQKLETEIFDSRSADWFSAGALNTTRDFMTLVGLPGGMALAAGGCSVQRPGQSASQALSSVELFDPSSRRWSLTTPMPSAACGPKSVLLADGRVLVVGGSTIGPNGLLPVQAANLFDPQRHAWAAAGSPAVSSTAGVLSSPEPLLQKDGTVLLLSEEQGPPQGTRATTLMGGQVYVPAENTWRFVTTTSVPVTRAFGPPSDWTSIALPSGKALVFLESATLAFDPRGSPPADQALDNLSLTWILLGLAGALAVVLGVGYMLARWSRRVESSD